MDVIGAGLGRTGRLARGVPRVPVHGRFPWLFLLAGAPGECRAWAPLCAFLGVQAPDEPFPRVNDRRSYQEAVVALFRHD